MLPTNDDMKDTLDRFFHLAALSSSYKDSAMFMEALRWCFREGYLNGFVDGHADCRVTMTKALEPLGLKLK